MDDSTPPRSESRQARPFEPFAPALRDYRGDPRLARIWRRLGEQPKPGARRGSGLLLLAVAALAGALGYVGGRQSVSLPYQPRWLAAHEDILDARRPELRGAPPSSEGEDVVRPAARPEEVRSRPSRSSAVRATGRVRSSPVVEVETPQAQVPLPPISFGQSPFGQAYGPDSSGSRLSWVELAERGQYAQAFQALDETGRLAEVVAFGSPEELMTMADVARFAGRTGWAIQALREVTTRHVGDENAPIAAMMLGNLLSRAGDGLGAARAYARSRQLSPDGDFAEDALVREFFAASNSAEAGQAQALLREYEQKFPNGEHLGEMQEALESQLGSETSTALDGERDVVEGEAELEPEVE
jgi:hypothetical protein